MGLRPAIGEIIIAVGVLVLAVVVLWQTMSIPVSPIYAKVGPTVVPMITAAALALLGVLLMFSALTGGWQTEEERNVKPDRPALLWIAAGLVLNVLLIGTAGAILRHKGANVNSPADVVSGRSPVSMCRTSWTRTFRL